MSDTDKCVEAVARVLDPRAWEAGNMVPGKTITLAMHTRRQASYGKARAAMREHLRQIREPDFDKTESACFHVESGFDPYHPDDGISANAAHADFAARWQSVVDGLIAEIGDED